MPTAKKAPVEPSATPDPRAIERKFYKDLGLPYCEKCYRPLATDLTGKPMCQVGADACPMVKQE